MKKFLAIILCVVFVMALAITPAFAATKSKAYKVPPAVYFKGDLNYDGYINSVDALLALRGAKGLLTLSDNQIWCADLDGNGLTEADAEGILRIAMGLITKGDVNGDGVVDETDVELAMRMAMGLEPDIAPEYYWAADLNNNGLDMTDALAIARIVKNLIVKYDVNADGEVNTVDALCASRILNGRIENSNPGWYWSADVDNNGILNQVDIEMIMQAAMNN